MSKRVQSHGETDMYLCQGGCSLLAKRCSLVSALALAQISISRTRRPTAGIGVLLQASKIRIPWQE